MIAQRRYPASLHTKKVGQNKSKTAMRKSWSLPRRTFLKGLGTAVGQWAVALPRPLSRALAAGVVELDARRDAMRMMQRIDVAPRRDLLIIPDAGTAMRDAAIAQHLSLIHI